MATIIGIRESTYSHKDSHFNQTQKGDVMINLFLIAFIACGDEEKEDTAPTSEPVEESAEEGTEE